MNPSLKPPFQPSHATSGLITSQEWGAITLGASVSCRPSLPACLQEGRQEWLMGDGMWVQSQGNGGREDGTNGR